jgi:hypothetical protein
MKFSTLILILIPWQIILSQNTENLSPDEEIESFLIGEWILKGSEVASRYEFSKSENGIINCQIFQYFEKNDNLTEISHNTIVSVSENRMNYELKWDSSKFHWKGDIEKITESKIFLKVNGNILKFVKN